MQTWIDQHPSALPVLFPIFFVGLWLFVCAIIGTISGWSTLADRFRFTGDFAGQRWWMQSGMMRFLCNYNNCLILGCDDTGLYLGILFLFRFMHPPLLIPWDQISVSRRKILFFDYVRFELGREERVPLWLRPYSAERIKNAAVIHWPVETIG